MKIDLIGYDNKYFMVFIKKSNKSTKNKGQTTKLKGEKTNNIAVLKPIEDEK